MLYSSNDSFARFVRLHNNFPALMFDGSANESHIVSAFFTNFSDSWTFTLRFIVPQYSLEP